LAQLQQCTWAALSGNLSSLLAYSKCTDDRLWSYLNCAVEDLFDEGVSTDSERKYFNDEDLRKTTSEIFTELFHVSKEKFSSNIV
jgi:hypothetical protein